MGFSNAAATRAGLGASDRGAAAGAGGVGFCTGVFTGRCAGAAASPEGAACALAGCDAPLACDVLDDCEFGAGEPAACGVPNVCDASDDPCAAVVALLAAGGSPCAFDASGVGPPGCTVGCSGPLGCGMAGPLLPVDSGRECESSPKLMVYDLNGGSSDEVGLEPADAGAERPFGPDSSSGTNNTIRTTRMIAPVSRSFTRSSKVGTKTLQSSGWWPWRPVIIAVTGS